MERGKIMSRLEDASITIYEALQNIRNKKYVMPAFQRQYIWSMEQIEKLWDSILLDYPIATFLFWNVNNENVTWDTYFCNFLSSVTFNSRKQADSTNYTLSGIDTRDTNTAVLDGQQRLTSLFLSLFGEGYIRQKHTRKKSNNNLVTKLLIELNKDKLALEEEEYNSKKYDIRFSEKIGKLSPTQFEIKKILDERFQDDSTREEAIEKEIENVPMDSRQYARDILNKLYKKIFVEKLLRFTEIYDMKQDDALEMFVRFNNGGKALRKSEITMSILEVYWPNARTEFGKVLKNSYEEFDSDFLIRFALMLYGDVIKSNISKKIATALKDNWSNFRKALEDLEYILKGLKIQVSRFSGSWNVLLPILYSIYYNPNYRDNIEGIHSYLVRAILFTYFQSGTTGKLQQMKNNINAYDYEITVNMLNQMREFNVTEGKIEDIVNAEKGSRIAGEVLYYLSLDWINENYKYEQDHLHPDERFNGYSPLISKEEWISWRGNRNRLPNLHLLEGRSNASKNNMRLIDYYEDMNNEQKIEFYRQSFIPDGVSLEFEDFGNFYEKRKLILTEKIRKLLG